MRAVVDVCVWVAALLSKSDKAAPRELMRKVESGRLRPIISPNLLKEASTVLARKKFRKDISEKEAEIFLETLRRHAEFKPDVENPRIMTEDPKDDYLAELAQAQGAELASLDKHVLMAGLTPPAITPRELINRLPSFRTRQQLHQQSNWMLQIRRLDQALTAVTLPKITEPSDKLLVPHQLPPQALVRPVQYTPGPRPRSLSSFMKRS